MTSTTTFSAPRAPRRDSADNRAALLAAARRVLNQDAEASMETIAAEAGLSRRAIYGHFANRDELLHELVSTGSARISGALENVTHPDPVVRLALIVSRVWRELTDVRVMVLLTVRGPLMVHTSAGLAPLRRAVLDCVVEAQASGAIRTDIEPGRLARLVEGAALDVLADIPSPAGDRQPAAPDDGQRTAIAMTLGVIGFGWHDADDFLSTHPELLREDEA